MPFNQCQKKLNTPHKQPEPINKPDTCNNDLQSHEQLDALCAIFPSKGENLSYVRPKFSSITKRRALIDTGSCANALPQSLFDDLEKQNPNGITLETPSFTSVRMASGQKIVIDKQAFVFYWSAFFY